MKRASGGPRPPIGAGLLLMSLGSGCIDVLGYRFLGEVFTSAMTGNAALLGSRLGAGDVATAIRNLAALGGFIGGLFVGTFMLKGGAGRLRIVLALTLQLALLLGFALLWPLHAEPPGRYLLIALASLAMGIQSSLAHRIGVLGVSTTYFTGTLANIVFGLVEPAAAANPALPPVRRVAWPILAFLTYLAGAAGAGWYTSGERWANLPFLPCATTAALIAIMALAGPARKAA